MQALILAAGDGDRLRPQTLRTPKPLLMLGDQPIITHVIDALGAAGVRDIAVVVGYRGAQIRRALTATPPGVRVRFVQNDAYEAGNARSIWEARNAIDGPFLLVMADHVCEPALYAALLDGAGECCGLAVERSAPGDPRASEATLALVEGGRVIDLGKGIAEWNALDTGALWCTQRVFDALTLANRDGEAGAIFAALARAGELDAVDVTGARWIDIDTEEDLRAADTLFADDARIA